MSMYNGQTAVITDQRFHDCIKSNENMLDNIGIKKENGIWIFGYGSLTYKANFKYSDKQVAYIEGYVRRFWQASTDHRGTPQKVGEISV